MNNDGRDQNSSHRHRFAGLEGLDIDSSPEPVKQNESQKEKKNKPKVTSKGPSKGSNEKNADQKKDAKTAVERKEKRDTQTAVEKKTAAEKTSADLKTANQKTDLKTSAEASARSQHPTRHHPKSDDKTYNEVCGAGMGPGRQISRDMFEKLEIEAPVPENKSEIHLSRSLMVSGAGLPEEWNGPLELCDWIAKANGQTMNSRDQFRRLCSKLKTEHAKTIKLTVYRLVKLRKIEKPTECKDIPQVIEIQPGYEYYYAFLYLSLKSSLGISIKSVSGKVYIANLDNGFKNSAKNTLVVGDAILQINGEAISSVKDASKRLTESLKAQKFVRIVIERAASSQAINMVRMALLFEKTVEIDPRLPDDVNEICAREIRHFENNHDAISSKSIIHRKRSQSPVCISVSSKETAIGMDSVNPQMLLPTPPVPGPNAKPLVRRI